MPIRMPLNAHLRTERKPLLPLPRTYRPGASFTYRVTDLDTREGWASVARKYGLDVRRLIRFNFETENSDEVNWYLRNYVGCDVATDDRQNWMFSSSANPGIIYLPNKVVDGDGHVFESRKTISSNFAFEFSGPGSPLDTIGKVFDAMQMLDAVGLMPELGAVLGIVLPTVGQFVIVGAPHEAALNELRKTQILEGLSLGIVMTADERTPQWIDAHGFVKKVPVNNVNYREYGKQLQGLYNTSLLKGIAHGKQFNSVARKNLFMFLQAQMIDATRKLYSEKPESWSGEKWGDYYRVCAGILRRKMKLT
jgi:hypothetical protein